MKRGMPCFFAVLTAAALLLCACNGTNPPGESPDGEITEAAPDASETAPDEENEMRDLGYVIVTDFVDITGTREISGEIQKVIDDNPHRTIYFPDGLYRLSHPIVTPADPKKSVDLRLSNYAELRASSDWRRSEGAMVRLGGKDAANDTNTPGSNYSLTGGIINGNGFADGIAIEGGRETKVADVSIKKTVVGLTVKYGANSGSSDADIRDINIIGAGTTASVGIVVEGYDNTFTNIRIGKVQIGMQLKSQANSLTNIHPLYNMDFTGFADSVGFDDQSGNNWYYFCYSDQFATGFRIAGGRSSIFNSCFCFWWTSQGGVETAFRAEGQFNSVVNDFRATFREDTQNAVLKCPGGGQGFFNNLLINPDRVQDKTYEKYLQGKIIK